MIPTWGKTVKGYCRSTSLERKTEGEGRNGNPLHSGRQRAEKDDSPRHILLFKIEAGK